MATPDPSGELVIDAVYRDLFSLPPKETLDERSRCLLWAFTD
jgi:hypothetical protein